jgi:hypothetical protein
VTRPRDHDRRAKGRDRGGGGGGGGGGQGESEGETGVAAAGKQPWLIGLGASIGLEASRRQGVEASKRRLVGGRVVVDGSPAAHDVWAPLISRWTLPPAARPCRPCTLQARVHALLWGSHCRDCLDCLDTFPELLSPSPSLSLSLYSLPPSHTHTHTLSLSLLVHTLLSPSLSCHPPPLVCPAFGIDCPLARLPL